MKCEVGCGVLAASTLEQRCGKCFVPLPSADKAVAQRCTSHTEQFAVCLHGRGTVCDLDIM